MGRLTQLADDYTDIFFTYDNVGRVIEHHLSDKDGHSQVMRYTYDANGNRLQTRLPNGEHIDYHYYGSGHLSAIKFNDRLITDMARDKLHREVSRTQGKLVTSFKLDAIGRLEEQLAKLDEQTAAHSFNAGANLVARTYRYDETGNLTQSRDIRLGNQDYYYDKLGQLIMTHQETFAFDPAHNLITEENHKLLNNQLNEYQGVAYRYDVFSNLSERRHKNGEVQTYTYNAKDLLTKVTIQKPNRKAEEWHYQYDVLNRRITKVRSENGTFLAHTKTEFVWDGSHLVQEISRQNDRTYSYIYRSPQSYEPLAQVYTDGRQNLTQTHYFHCDQIDIPRELTDEEGNLCWFEDYSGWGKLNSSHNIMEDTHQPFRLQNQYADEETGLHYNFFRYYDPHIGRFTQLDPIGLAGGNNLYQFAANTQTWIDPLGLARFCTRPLSGMPWGIHTDVDKNYRDGLDLGIFHEHIFFDDGTNVGYTTTGTFSERSQVGYKCSDKNYDDTIMKQAVKNVKNKKVQYLEKTDNGGLIVKEKLRFGKNDYNVIVNNCQDFVTEVEKEYYKLEKRRK